MVSPLKKNLYTHEYKKRKIQNLVESTRDELFPYSSSY